MNIDTTCILYKYFWCVEFIFRTHQKNCSWKKKTLLFSVYLVSHIDVHHLSLNFSNSFFKGTSRIVQNTIMHLFEGPVLIIMISDSVSIPSNSRYQKSAHSQRQKVSDVFSQFCIENFPITFAKRLFSKAIQNLKGPWTLAVSIGMW